VAVIAGHSLRKYLRKKIVVTPILDPGQIGFSSIDVRLGSHFLVSDRTRHAQIDAHEQITGELRTQRHVFVPLGKSFILHPEGFALGVTLEYVRLHRSVFAFLEGRSSPGRAGLLVATAAIIHPGYAGCLTLELVNAGDTPIKIYPGDRIGQLAFLHVSGALEEGTSKVSASRYRIAIEPEYSKWYEDKEKDLLLQSHFFEG